MENFYTEAVSLIQAGQSFVMASIIEGTGSMPRGAGTKMIIRQDGSSFATIGGGKLEAEALIKARNVFRDKAPCLYSFNISGEDAAKADMICGGRGKILLDYINDDDLGIYLAARNALEQQQSGWLVTMIDEREKPLKCQAAFVPKNSGNILKQGMQAEEGAGVRYYIEPIYSGGTVYLFGAGHVAREVAKVAQIVEFQTVVIDDRKDLANNERFPGSECIVLTSWDQLPALPVNEDSYIVIVTPGHLQDRQCLQWALGTDAGYIGMIGSSRKREMVYAQLKEEGVTPQQLARAKSPIGLQIGAETPAEIAVCIVAELIQVRAERYGK